MSRHALADAAQPSSSNSASGYALDPQGALGDNVRIAIRKEYGVDTHMRGVDRAPVGYMERTRRYYRALGYSNDYKWSHYQDVPFTPLTKPLSGSRLAIVTTSSPPGGPPGGNRKLKTVWSGSTGDTPADLHTEFLAWDKETTHMRDRETYLPILALRALAAEGRIGGLTDRFFGVPTTYSQRQTNEQDAPHILRLCREDGADAAILVPI